MGEEHYLQTFIYTKLLNLLHCNHQQDLGATFGNV